MNTPRTNALMLYRFTRTVVQRQDLSPFLRRYDPALLPPWQYLPDLFGRMSFYFEGYEENWLFEPGLRQFWRTFHQCWPYWVLFCDLAQEDLRFMTLGSLYSFRLITVPGQLNGAVFYERDELESFLDDDISRTLDRCGWFRGMKRRLMLRRWDAGEYFRQPVHPVILQAAEQAESARRGPLKATDRR